MKYNPDIHHRRSIRLQGYDYSQTGAYFVTICTQNRACLFGNIVDGKMALNDAGRMVEQWYRELENKFRDIRCDEFIIMPNHFHCIVINVGADLRVRPDNIMRVRPDAGQLHEIAPTISGEHKTGEHIGSPLRAVVQWFKTMTTNAYIHGVKQHGWPRFDGKLWQRNYYEYIIRNENELNWVRQYIIDNPENWKSDRNYPTDNAHAVCAPIPKYGDESWMI